MLIRRQRKSIGIRITEARVELVAHPAISQEQLREVLFKRQDWISRHVLKQRESLPSEGIPEQVSILGRPLPLRWREGAKPSAKLEDDSLVLSGLDSHDGPAGKALIGRVLVKEARLYLRERLFELAGEAGLSPSACLLSSARTRWGSCTSKGVIRLNWRLIQAPAAIVDYVIAHELAHLTHMNHSAAFWSETARIYPAWRAARQWLKTHGSSLFTFG